MELSIFLAKMFGVLMLAIGLGMLFDRKFYDKMLKDFLSDSAHLFTTGFLALIAGLAMVTYHNIWQGEWWVVLVTIFGWISLLKGVMRILFPSMVMGWIKSILGNKSLMTGMTGFAIAIGIIFSYYGFFA